MTKQQLVKLIKEKFTTKNSVVDISEMDFGDTSVDISGIKTRGTLFQNNQIVSGTLFQNNQIVSGNLFQDNQTVGKSVFQDSQKANRVVN